MKKIPLSQGKFALVDDEDFEWLNQWKWQAHKSYNNWYATRKVRGIDNVRKELKMHRQILGITDLKILGEHADGDGLNNQRHNLRPATNSENQKNKKSRGTSRYLGVCWHKTRGYWLAKIVIDGKQKHLGCFSDEVLAAKSYNDMAKIHHGAFARLNAIPADVL